MIKQIIGCGLAVLTVVSTCGAMAATQSHVNVVAPAMTAALKAEISKAYDLLSNDMPVQAEESLNSALKSLKPQAITEYPSNEAELISSLAACYLAEDNYDKAKNHLEHLIELLKASPSSICRYERLLSEKRLGDVWYMDHNAEKAFDYYSEALKESQTILRPGEPLIRMLLDAVVGSLIAQKRWKDAEPFCLRLIDACTVTETRPRPNIDLMRGWAYLNLGRIYHETEQPEDKIVKCRQQAIDCFRSVMKARLIAGQEFAGGTEELDKIFAHQPDPYSKMMADKLWAALRLPRKTLPVLTWTNTAKAPTALLLCVHGLGLSNASFEDFGKRLAEKGYAVTAIDVRGFGSFSAAQGFDEIDYNSSLQDIKLFLELLHSMYHNIPVVLVGESMGGGIALHAAAEYPELMDALITSAPAAGRYEAVKTARKVARNFVFGPRKQFDIGTQVIDQATDNPELRRRWKEDPKARLEMSPIELLKFDAFMKKNIEKAGQISSIPVLVLQGVDDHLVKPRSTFDLFEAIPSKNRDLWVVSNQEHLILEDGQCPDPLMDSIINWLKTRVHRTTVMKSPSGS